MMPDLPNVGWERDIEAFREFFENPEFRWGILLDSCFGEPGGCTSTLGVQGFMPFGSSCPQPASFPRSFRSDGLKLYPTLVIRGTGLYELWKVRGRRQGMEAWPPWFCAGACGGGASNDRGARVPRPAACWTSGRGTPSHHPPATHPPSQAGLYRNYAPDRLVDLTARCAHGRADGVCACAWARPPALTLRRRQAASWHAASRRHPCMIHHLCHHRTHPRSILALVPPWVRVYRVQRDIPMPLVTSGVEKGNLRELVRRARAPPHF